MLLQVSLTYVRMTKGLCRYEEEVKEGEKALMGVMYLAKERLGDKPPKRVTLTLEGSDATD